MDADEAARLNRETARWVMDWRCGGYPPDAWLHVGGNPTAYTRMPGWQRAGRSYWDPCGDPRCREVLAEHLRGLGYGVHEMRYPREQAPYVALVWRGAPVRGEGESAGEALARAAVEVMRGKG